MCLQLSAYTHLYFIDLSLATRRDFRSGRAIFSLASDWGVLGYLRGALSDDLFKIIEKVCFSLLFIFQLKLMSFL